MLSPFPEGVKSNIDDGASKPKLPGPERPDAQSAKRHLLSPIFPPSPPRHRIQPGCDPEPCRSAARENDCIGAKGVANGGQQGGWGTAKMEASEGRREGGRLVHDVTS
jgi:hypothetical protein